MHNGMMSYVVVVQTIQCDVWPSFFAHLKQWCTVEAETQTEILKRILGESRKEVKDCRPCHHVITFSLLQKWTAQPDMSANLLSLVIFFDCLGNYTERSQDTNFSAVIDLRSHCNSYLPVVNSVIVNVTQN